MKVDLAKKVMLEMSVEEAHWLKRIVCGPLYGDLGSSSSPKDMRFRDTLCEALNNALEDS